MSVIPKKLKAPNKFTVNGVEIIEVNVPECNDCIFDGYYQGCTVSRDTNNFYKTSINIRHCEFRNTSYRVANLCDEIIIYKDFIDGTEVYIAICPKYPDLKDYAPTKEEAERLMRESIEMTEAIIKESEE